MWNSIKEQQPEIGLTVKVETIYGFEDTGIWDGKQWINNEGKFKGEPDEAPKWKLIIGA